MAVAPSTAGDSLAGIEKVDVCGTGWVDAEPDGSVDLEPIMISPPAVDARRRLLDQIGAAGDLGAAARLLIELGSRGDGTMPLMLLSACDSGGCVVSEDDRAAAEALFARLVGLASTTNDPRVYALAFEACGWQPQSGSCSVLNAAQWARIDAGNAVPWTYLLADASARKDRGAVDDALFHIGAADRVEERRYAVASIVARNAGRSDTDLFAAEQVGQRAASIAGMRTTSALFNAYKACRSDEIVDSNRRELCERVAKTLVERSDSIKTLGLGNAIGRRLGWPDERFDTANAIAEAAADALPIVAPPIDPARPAASMRGPLDCGAVARKLRYVADLGSLGEVEYARRWLDRPGKAAEYLRRGRERRAMVVAREAAERTAAASAPRR
jgi:hypothetical protein